MGLREQAALDTQRILQDSSAFGAPIILTSPTGVKTNLVGFSMDIGVTIDPETGQSVSGRRASVALPLLSLPELPVLSADTSRKPWLVQFSDAKGVGAVWKATEVIPDRAAGIVVLLLETYHLAPDVVLEPLTPLPSLRQQAVQDSQSILQDSFGFGTPITLTSPSGVTTDLMGFATDIGYEIDPETGQQVAGRRASVALPLLSLPEVPVVSADGNRKPWLVRFFNLKGVPAAWRAIEVLPDRALGVVVLLLEVFQQAIVNFANSVLVLPSLLLSGSLLPIVALSGALALPSGVQLEGEVTPSVEVSGTLPLSAGQLSGDFSPEVGELTGDLELPGLQLEASLEPEVGELTGSWMLPSLVLDGALSSDVGLSGTLPLPALQLSGATIAPTVGLGGTLPLSALQLSGSLAPTVGALSGALGLPKLAVSGGVSPTVGALTGSLVLPSLQLTGTLTVSTSPVSSWLRLAASTITAGEYDTVANVLVPSNPTNQPGAVRKPAAATSANGLPLCLWDGTDVLVWPIVASNNNPAVFGLHVWVKPTNIAARQRIVSGYFGATNGARVLFDIVGNGVLIQATSTYPNGMQYEKTNCLTLNVWQSLFFLVNANGATNADKLQFRLNGNLITPSAYYSLGTGDLSVLGTASGVYTLGATTDTDTPGQAFAAGTLTGPNWHFFNAVPTVTAVDSIRNFEVPT